jgi:3-isopropylmalate/(R)-2-methylmalate dehydratase small subunit
MDKFTTHTGTVALLDRDNVDTDQIIPKQFLKRTERTGYSDCLFFDWRFDSEGKPSLEFPLNLPQYAGATILVTGKNFGCGSSREHAVWALRDYGFRCIIAQSFADIFANNCVRNGILTLAARPSELIRLKERDAAGRFRLTIDLQNCAITGCGGYQWHFEIDSFRRTCLLEGLDEIGMTLKKEQEIAAHEQRRKAVDQLR